MTEAEDIKDLKRKYSDMLLRMNIFATQIDGFVEKLKKWERKVNNAFCELQEYGTDEVVSCKFCGIDSKVAKRFMVYHIVTTHPNEPEVKNWLKGLEELLEANP